MITRVQHALVVRPWWRQLGALAHVARTRTAAMFAYRMTMFLLLGVSIVQIFMLTRVWSALYAARPGVLALPLEDLLLYLTIANLITWSLPTHTVSRHLRERVREGSVVFDLVRPVGFVPQLVAQMAGALAGALAVIGLGLPVVAFAGSLGPPSGPAAGGLFLLSLLLAYAVAGLLAILIGMIAFWTVEVNGLVMLYVLVSTFLSGALVPVTAFPEVLREVVRWLPFQATTYVPATIYVGGMDARQAIRAIALQAVWVAILGFVASAVWRRAIRRVVVQGG